MATATKAKTETRNQSVTLLTDRHDYRAVIEGAEVIRNARGTKIGEDRGTVLAFRGERAEITREKRPGDDEPKAYCNGIEQAWSFEDLMKAIEKHPLYNVRFWKENDAPWDPKPSLPDLRKTLKGASPDEIRSLYEAERAGHNRTEALALISEALMAQEPAPEKPKGKQTQGADAGKDNDSGTPNPE